MSPPLRGLLDTSVFIAHESGRRLEEARLPEESAVSVITVTELQAGVLAATDTAIRAIRLATLDAVGDMVILPVDERAAAAWARLRVLLAEAGRRMNVNDLWIAATAVSQDLPVVTQDSDFDAIVGLPGVSVLRV